MFFSYHIPTNSKAPISAYKHSHTTHNFSIHSEEGLMLKTSTMKLLTVAIYVINSVVNTKLPCYTLPPTQHHSFFRNLPPLFICLIMFAEFSITPANNP